MSTATKLKKYMIEQVFALSAANDHLKKLACLNVIRPHLPSYLIVPKIFSMLAVRRMVGAMPFDTT